MNISFLSPVRVILLLILSPILLSCGGESVQMSVINFNMDLFDTCSVKMADTVKVPVTGECFGELYDSRYGYIVGQRDGGETLHLVDTITSELKYTFGHTGRGPNEFIAPAMVDMDYSGGFLYINDAPKGELSRIVLQENSAYIDTSFLVSGLYTGWSGVDDSLCISLYDFDNKAALSLINVNQGTENRFIHSLLEDKRITNPVFVTNQSSVRLCRKKNLAVCMGAMLPAVACYSYNAKEMTLEWRLFLEENIYHMAGGMPLAHDNIRFDINRTCLTDNYIYLALKKRREMADGFNYVLRVDYTGRPVNLYKIACNFNSFLITRDESTLVGLAGELEGYLVRVAL